MRVAFAVAVLAIVSACSGPALLSGVDRLYGPRNSARVVTASGFGAHGQTLDVWRATGADAGPRPIVVFFYGGGWKDGRRADYGFAGRAFAANGFVTIVPDYRKAPAHPFPAFMTDAAQAVAWAHANAARIGGDPTRIALIGHSAGAHIATLLALDPHYLIEAGAPAGAVKAVVGIAGPYDFAPFTNARAKAAFGAWPTPADTQPITFATRHAPPMLLLTGDADTTVLPRNTQALAAALTRAGAPVRTRIYPGLGHVGAVTALSRPFARKAPVLADTTAFLRETLN